MKFWKTYVVLAVAGGLLAYILLVERKREDKPDKPKEKVATLDKSKAREITITRGTGDEIRLVRQGETWRMTAPQEVVADTGEVQNLLSSLESLEMEEVVAENATNLPDFGLQPPRVSVTVAVEGQGQPVRIALGNKTPDESGLYARRPDQPRVFTVPGHLESTFDKKPFDLRDRDLLHVKRDAVRSLSITGPEGAYTLQREGAEWVFSSPLPTRAGRWTVDALLGTLEALRMDEVAAEAATDKQLKEYGLQPPARTLTVGLAEGGTRTLELGGATADKKRYARIAGSPLVAVIAPALFDDLAKGMNEYRAKRLLEVATYEVQGIEIVSPAGRRAYERSSVKDKDGVDTYKWKRTAPDAKEIDTNAVQDLLFELGGLEAVQFIDQPVAPATYGLEAPALKVTLRHDTAEKPPVWFELGRKDGAVYARRIGDGSVLKLDAAKAEPIVKKFLEL